MTGNSLSRLEKVEVREIWADEARDFTPWLASDGNISLLGDTIGLELEVEAQEKSVGPFKADILCKETADDHYVLIENQLEKTNHIHLGQLVTYAAGLHAATIVWIADTIRDEHRAAIDWLNEITSEDFRFFALEIEAWRIGNSPAAPKFNVVSKPNDWSSDVSQAARSSSSGELSDTKRLQLEYWIALRERMEASRSSISYRKPRPQHWQTFPIGRSKFGLTASVNTQAGFLRVAVSCKGPNALAHFELLQQNREEIEREFGEQLEWEELPTRKASRISIKQHNVDPMDRSQWDFQLAWIQERLETFDRTFRSKIRMLDAASFDPEDLDRHEP